MSDSEWTKEEVERVRMTIRKQAMTDPDFRQRVLRVPNQVIEEISGKSVPKGFQFDVIESKPGVDHTFVLPPLRSEDLSDEELDHMAAGSSCVCWSNPSSSSYKG